MKYKPVKVFIVLLITLATHWLAVTYLPQDFDEPVYTEAAMEYARALEQGDFNAVIDSPNNREHPALVKLTFGVAAYLNGSAHNYSETLQTGRVVSVVFGILGHLSSRSLTPLRAD